MNAFSSSFILVEIVGSVELIRCFITKKVSIYIRFVAKSLIIIRIF